MLCCSDDGLQPRKVIFLVSCDRRRCFSNQRYDIMHMHRMSSQGKVIGRHAESKRNGCNYKQQKEWKVVACAIKRNCCINAG